MKGLDSTTRSSRSRHLLRVRAAHPLVVDTIGLEICIPQGGGGGGIMIAQCDTASLIEKTGLFRAHVFSLEPLGYTYLSPFRSTGTAHKTCISVYNAKKLCPLNWECSLTKQMSGDGQPKGERASVKGED